MKVDIEPVEIFTRKINPYAHLYLTRMVNQTNVESLYVWERPPCGPLHRIIIGLEGDMKLYFMSVYQIFLNSESYHFKKLRSTLTTQNEALTQCNGRVAKI